MTADEWDRAGDWAALLEALPEAAADDRRLRLWVIGAVERAPDADINPWTWEAMQDVFAACEAPTDRSMSESLAGAQYRAMRVGRASRYDNPIDLAVELIARREYNRPLWYSTVAHAAAAVERLSPLVTVLFRCVFGNPFRPVAVDPGWRTEAVVALARGMYDGRDFAAMPVLADALEDAGCDHPDVLAHCRDPQGVHVRGCWVVDGVLGLS